MGLSAPGAGRGSRRSGIAPLNRFAKRLWPYVPGILAHRYWPLGTNLVEDIKNKIKVNKRRAYGLRDDAYFFPRSGRLSPELGDEPKKVGQPEGWPIYWPIGCGPNYCRTIILDATSGAPAAACKPTIPTNSPGTRETGRVDRTLV